MSKSINYEMNIPAPVKDLWKAWTTEQGVKSFFAPECKIELKPGGAYEMLFNKEAPPGEQGGEGMIILAIQPEKMLSFTWNSPPTLPDVRGQMTHVTLRFTESNTGESRLHFVHDGWGEGGEWDQSFDYFIRAWGEVVLPRLKYRFEEGPIDWNNPPMLSSRSK
jgi:uncharacterized protein YndB with AHSA1/START domain